MLEVISTSGSFVQDKAEEAAKCIAELDVDRDGQVTNHSPPSGHVTQCSPPIGQVSYPEFLLVWRFRE